MKIDKYRIFWNYPGEVTIPKHEVGRPEVSGECVTCTIVDESQISAANPKGVAIGRGVAYCVPGDVFDKDTGRKISLTKAVQQTFGQTAENRKLRTLIWEAYRMMKPPTEKNPLGGRWKPRSEKKKA